MRRHLTITPKSDSVLIPIWSGHQKRYKISGNSVTQPNTQVVKKAWKYGTFGYEKQLGAAASMSLPALPRVFGSPRGRNKKAPAGRCFFYCRRFFAREAASPPVSSGRSEDLSFAIAARAVDERPGGRIPLEAAAPAAAAGEAVLWLWNLSVRNDLPGSGFFCRRADTLLYFFFLFAMQFITNAIELHIKPAINKIWFFPSWKIQRARQIKPANANAMPQNNRILFLSIYKSLPFRHLDRIISIIPSNIRGKEMPSVKPESASWISVPPIKCE